MYYIINTLTLSLTLSGNLVSLKKMRIMISLLLQKSGVPVTAVFFHPPKCDDALPYTCSPRETRRHQPEHPSRKSCLSACEIPFLINSFTVVQRPGMKQRSGNAQNLSETDASNGSAIVNKLVRLYGTRSFH
jgi:hypothetical protein